jgi:hypothetical protein
VKQYGCFYWSLLATFTLLALPLSHKFCGRQTQYHALPPPANDNHCYSHFDLSHSCCLSSSVSNFSALAGFTSSLSTLSSNSGPSLQSFHPRGSRVSSGSIVSDYGLDDRAIGVRSPAGARIFPLASVSRPALGPTQPPVQWVPRVLSPGVKRGRGVALTTHPHLVSRSRMSRSYTSSPPKHLHGV